MSYGKLAQLKILFPNQFHNAKPTPDPKPSVGSTAPPPLLFTPAPPAPLLESSTLQHLPVSFLSSRMHSLSPGVPQGWPRSQRPGICHYPAVVLEVLGHLACCFLAGFLTSFVDCKFSSMQSMWCSGLAWEPLNSGNHTLSLLMGQFSPEPWHFQGLKLTVCWVSSI